jgi:hypothetical protein
VGVLETPVTLRLLEDLAALLLRVDRSLDPGHQRILSIFLSAP